MFRRREPVPFAFVAESERYRSNVTPPPRARASRSQLARQALVGITVTAGLVGALLFGMPAMQAGTQSTHHTQQSEAKDGR
ncbi:membrane protein [Streptomyces eurocidicus]|uniref:Membrane protein n=1 Tax=Streptomyces eurocidicus TaxID=66423 RepID=A0A2N8NNJ0_STREU|nr:hypothetical protein [Streptomyces eurocidicus]MBB5116606.1 hypothetical protein [Streptomyces eurocidicus]MBF6052392.1 hypothetical protein [Streptomyces eurocidicus]PNE30339.1 membrane protein [Streptomyces eurocidicus]